MHKIQMPGRSLPAALYTATRIGLVLCIPILWGTVFHTLTHRGKLAVGAGLLCGGGAMTLAPVYYFLAKGRRLRTVHILSSGLVCAAMAGLLPALPARLLRVAVPSFAALLAAELLWLRFIWRRSS